MQNKRWIISVVAAITFLAASGCKKDYQNTKVYLLTRQITDTREGGGVLDTIFFSYDDHDRITQVIEGLAPHKTIYTAVFDDKNRVITARKLDNNGNLIVEYDFFYNTDTVGYYYYGPTHAADTAYLSFNSQHQVTKINTRHSGSETYDYDNRGNIILTRSYDNKGGNDLSDDNAYQYDIMKNPLAETPRGNYFLMYVVFIYDPTTLINNVANKNGYDYTYSYNVAGFPTNASINYFYYKTYIKYEYQLR